MSRFSGKKDSNMGYQKSGSFDNNSFGSSNFKKDKGFSDVIGSVVAIGDVVLVQSVVGHKIRRTVVIEDAESNQLDLYDLKLGHHVGKREGRGLGEVGIGNRGGGGLRGVKELPEYDESQFKIEAFMPQEPVVTIAKFFHGAVKKMVASIRECEHKTHYIMYARIHRLHKENGWAYTACKECNRIVDVVESKDSSSSGKSKVTFYCEEHGAVEVASR
ncbi:hypothetical protein Tco_0237196 [Tanacetum coccineum]